MLLYSILAHWCSFSSRVIHIILFIRACVETNRRNRMAAPILLMSGTGDPVYVVSPGQQVPVMVQEQQHAPPVIPSAAHFSSEPQQAGHFNQSTTPKHQHKAQLD